MISRKDIAKIIAKEQNWSNELTVEMGLRTSSGVETCIATYWFQSKYWAWSCTGCGYFEIITNDDSGGFEVQRTHRKSQCDTHLYNVFRQTIRSIPYTLYRMFDVNGVLLYVGISKRGRGRFYEHDAEKAWWSKVANITVEHCEGKAMAEQREKNAIRIERPKYNIQHAVRNA